MSDISLDCLINLFKDLFNYSPEKVEVLSGGGSSRKYYRFSKDELSVIGVIGNDREECDTFIRLSGFLKKEGINVPEVLIYSENKLCYLLQDLGDESLFSILSGPEKLLRSREALDKLLEFQLLKEEKWKHLVGYKPFSERLIKWDLNYFKYDFLKPADITFNEERLEDDFERITAKLTSPLIVNGLMYRDFQSRNIMIKDNSLWFIDYQGARKGPLVYDAVSFIWQAKAPFTFEERESLGEYYIEKLSKIKNINIDELKNQFELMQLFRSLQVLGAYGFRGLIENKAHFIESIPYAVRNLDYLKGRGRLNDYPELSEVVTQLKKSDFNKFHETNDGLLITVYSFSYKNGYPEDYTGNGGGFMFDCRGLHNPGRYDEFKPLTGLDMPVKKFLEDKGEAKHFIENCFRVVEPSILRYIQRGFTSLQIGFGCTGGRHRSVYCAEKIAEMIFQRQYKDVNIKIIHREQNITTNL